MAILDRITHISFPDMENEALHDLTTGIASGSMSLDELLVQGNISLGECNANKLEVQIFGLDDVSNKKIKVWQTDLKGENLKNIFEGYVDSCKLDNLGYYRDIVAYDAIYYKGRLNVANWWTEFWLPDQKETATLKEIRESICDYLELTYDKGVTYFNDDFVVTQTVTISNLSFANMLKMICELQCTFPNITRDGHIEFLTLPTIEEAIDISGLYEHESSTFETYTTELIDAVIIYGSGEEGVSSLDDDAKPNNAYTISGNIFTYDLEKDALKELAVNIFNKVSYISYQPADITMIQSNIDLHLGDLVKTDKGYSYVFANNLSGSLLVEQEIVAEGDQFLSEVDEQYNADIQALRKKTEDLTGDTLANKMVYYTYTNVYKYEVGEDELKVVDITVYTTDITDLIFLSNINLTVTPNKVKKTRTITFTEIDSETKEETEVSKDISYEDESPVVLYVRYMWEDGTIDYHPVQTYNHSGRYMLPLIYFLQDIPENMTGHFQVMLKCAGGTILIPKLDLIATVLGQGLDASDANWNGRIDIYEDLKPIKVSTDITVPKLRESYGFSYPDTGASSTITEAFKKVIVNTAIKLPGFTEQILDKIVIDNYTFQTTFKKNYEYSQKYIKTENDVFEMNLDYIVKGTSQTIDSGYLEAVEINTEQFSSVESIEVL